MHQLIIYFSTSSFTILLLGLALFCWLLIVFSAQRTEYLLYALIIWFPLETLVLRYTPIDYYAAVKYLPEVLIYSTALISYWHYRERTKRWFPDLPVNRWLILYLLVAVVSLIVNQYNVTIWFLGLRQLLRFVLIFFIVIFENFSPQILRRLLTIGIVVIIFEAILGIVQYFSGGILDRYLFFTDSISIGNSIELEGGQQTWAPGQRVFATLGRYDRLGSLLVIGLTMLFPWFYSLKTVIQKERWWLIFSICTLALVFTYSRASWVAFVAGIITVGYFIMRDRRFFRLVSVGGGLLVVYLLFVIVTQSFGTGAVALGQQSLRDRVVEAVSLYSWQQSYEGYGRFFFIVNTPLMVVRYYPLFGVGPGNYGSGVAASLLNRAVYEKLHLPFGIQNTYGQIDNNWLSIWGEVGTFGLIAWAGLFYEIFIVSFFVQKHSAESTQRLVAQGVCGSVVAIAVLGFFGPYFEFRSLMVYFWLFAGITFHYFREHVQAWNFLHEKKLEF
jgi:hypothetical protein